MTRIEAVVAWGSLVVLLMFVVLVSLVVTSTRSGHIVERRVLGCTLYFYEAPPFR